MRLLSPLQLHDHHVRDRGDGSGQRSAALEEERAGRGEMIKRRKEQALTLYVNILFNKMWAGQIALPLL